MCYTFFSESKLDEIQARKDLKYIKEKREQESKKPDVKPQTQWNMKGAFGCQI